jgi:hypothetical protein
MKRIDYARIRAEQDEVARHEVAKEILSTYRPDNPPYLSDIFVNWKNGGQMLLIALEEQEKEEQRKGVAGKPFTWKILIRRDEFGNVPQPGEVVERVEPINRKDRKHHPVRPGDLNAARTDGTFKEKYESRREYIVDPRGCIECSFQDAGYFLFNWGVHHKTNRGICNKPEHSGEPVKTPDGQHLHVWYWRYSEVDKGTYAELPERTLEKPTKKRGRPAAA